jgi:integrase
MRLVSHPEWANFYSVKTLKAGRRKAAGIPRGCSSHSGRRTFITNAAQKIIHIGRSILRDVQMLAGHSNIRTAQAYIEANPDAQVRIVELI